MKNKTPYLFIAALIISAVVTSLFINESKNITSSTDPAVAPVKTALFLLQQEKNFEKLNKKEKLEKISEVIEQLPPKYKKIKQQYQIAMSSAPDITFYGHVLDQYNQPVANTKISYTGTSNYLMTGAGRGAVLTDEQGYFEIDTHGAVLVIAGIEHKEITARGVVRFLSYSGDAEGFPNWHDYDEKDKAYVFNVWRLSQYEGAISGNIRDGYKRTGDTYTLKMEGGMKKQKIFEGEQSGHLRVSCTRKPHMEHHRDFGDWTARITPINGGIQETNDQYTNLAPESGYMPSLDIDMRLGTKDYVPYLRDKKYYFTSNNGKEYGSLQVSFEPHGKAEDDRYCIIRMSYKINPTGSRNLELKRSNTSQPQLPTAQKLASNL